MVDTRRSSAAKRRGLSDEASQPPTQAAASPATAEPASTPPPPPSRSRSGKRAKVARADDPGDKAGVDPAAVDVLDSSVENLHGVARPPAVNVAASSTVSNSAGRRKKNRPVRAYPTDEGTFWKTRPASGRAEAWGRLISQSSEYPSIPIYPAHFTIGHGGKCDLKLTETSPGSLICKLKHVKRGAALEIYMNKVVHVNGKALDKTAKVTITGGDEVIFVSLGRHAYIFEQLPEEKASTSSLCSKCVIQQEQYPVVKGTLDHLLSKGTKISTPFNFGNGRPPLIPHGEPLNLIIYSLRLRILGATQKLQRPRSILISARS